MRRCRFLLPRVRPKRRIVRCGFLRWGIRCAVRARAGLGVCLCSHRGRWRGRRCARIGGRRRDRCLLRSLRLGLVLVRGFMGEDGGGDGWGGSVCGWLTSDDDDFAFYSPRVLVSLNLVYWLCAEFLLTGLPNLRLYCEFLACPRMARVRGAAQRALCSALAALLWVGVPL